MDAITFDTGDGLTLKGELRLPDGEIRATAILCHPHPRHGGSKDHPLLWAIRNDLAARGFAVLTFNFRGVMGSEGSYGGGLTEPADLRAALTRVRAEAAGPTLVAGWSFGANVALRTALEDERIAALALIGMPLADTSLDLPELPPRDVLRLFDRPVLLVSGEADQFSPVPDLKSLARKLPRATLVVVKGTDHFFWKRERELAAVVGGFADRALFEPA